MKSGRALKYSFCETIDFLEGSRIFNILYFDKDSGKYIPVDEMQNADGCVIRRPNGREELDVTGMVQKEPMCSTTLLTTYDEGNADVFSINSMLSFRVKDPKNTHAQISAFELLLDKWLPMPMFHNNEYDDADRYAKKAKAAGQSGAQAIITTLDNLGYYD